MSKIGRKPIAIAGIQVDIKGQDVHFKGAKASGIYTLPLTLRVKKKDDILIVEPAVINAGLKRDRDLNRVWGLHRSLLANNITGSLKPFTEEVHIVGLGFKAVAAGKNLVLSLGYSHKIDFPLSPEVSVNIDKTGQKLVFESSNKQLLGGAVSLLKAQRPPEPYKGTGIKKASEEIFRKDSKKK